MVRSVSLILILLATTMSTQAQCLRKEYAQYRDQAKDKWMRQHVMVIDYCFAMKAAKRATDSILDRAQRGMLTKAKQQELSEEYERCAEEAQKMADAIRAADRGLPKGAKPTDLSCKD
jgi:hypothetical protein